MIKARRTSTNYVYTVEIDGETAADVLIKVVRCTARSNVYGLHRSNGDLISGQEFKSATAAAKAYAVLIGETVV